MRIFKPVAMATASLLFAGCSNHYLLSSQFVASSQAGKAPEIIETPFYLAERSNIRTVAVRAPDSCSNRTADEATGSATNRGTILQTNCGVEMAEIEKALAKMGYRVISWKVLAREMSKEKSANDIAAALGAEVLFQINSLEKSQKTLGKDARWERKYYQSNDAGAKLEERAFDDPTRSHFKRLYLDSFENRIDLRRLAVTLDANAVFVKSGESIWYYRWTHTDPTAIDYRKEILVQCKSNNRECQEKLPQGQQQAQTNMTAAGESEAISVMEKPEDKDKALYAELLSTVIDSLVKNFSKNEPVPYAPIVTPAPVVPVIPVALPPVVAATPATEPLPAKNEAAASPAAAEKPTQPEAPVSEPAQPASKPQPAATGGKKTRKNK